MQDALSQLGRTICVHTTMVGFAFHTHHVAIADRAAFRHREPLVAAWMLLIIKDLYDLGNHVATAFHHDPIADLYTQALDLVHVVQRRPAHRSAADRHRFEPRYGSEFAGTSHLHADVFDSGHATARSVLVGDSPSRRFTGEAQPLLQAQGVHFDDDAVDFVGQLVTHGFALG